MSGRVVQWCVAHDQRASSVAKSCQWSELFDGLFAALGRTSSESSRCQIEARFLQAVSTDPAVHDTAHKMLRRIARASK